MEFIASDASEKITPVVLNISVDFSLFLAMGGFPTKMKSYGGVIFFQKTGYFYPHPARPGY